MRPPILMSRGAGAAFGLLAFCVLTAGLAAGAGAAPPVQGLALGGGYTGPGPDLVSLEEALSLPTDTPVTVKGNITRYLGRDEYTFADSTGATLVRIPQTAWFGQHVGESDTVELQGEIKQEWTRTVIHVRRVIKR